MRKGNSEAMKFWCFCERGKLQMSILEMMWKLVKYNKKVQRSCFNDTRDLFTRCNKYNHKIICPFDITLEPIQQYCLISTAGSFTFKKYTNTQEYRT